MLTTGVIGILDGFDHYPTSAFLSDTACAIGTNWNLSPGTRGLSFVTGLGGQGKAVKMVNDTALDAQPVFSKTFIPGSATSNQLTLAFAIRIDPNGIISGVDTVDNIISLRRGSTVQFGMGVVSTARFRLTGQGGAVVATSSQVIQFGQVYRFNMTIDAVSLSACNVITKINGVVDTGLTGTFDLMADTTIGYNNFRFMGTSYFNSTDWLNWVLDDLIVIYDEIVDLPPMELFTQVATSDDTAQWSRSAGSAQYSQIDEIPVNAETDYNYSDTVGQKDIFNTTGLTRTPELILSVSQLTIARKEEAGVRTMRNLLKLGGVEYPSADYDTLEAYAHHYTHWTNNPATGVTWLPGELPPKFGYELRV